MKLDDIKRRVDELIRLAEQTLQTEQDGTYFSSVNHEMFYQLRSSTLSLLKNIYGESHPFYNEFNNLTREPEPHQVEYGKGILNSVKSEIEGGWIFTVKGLVSAEIFSDFLEMAEYLLEEGFKDPSAVMIGSVLEEHLKQLSLKNGLSIEVNKNGQVAPKKADTLNSELAGLNIYNKLDQKSITSWLDLRNKAAHGKYSEYTKEQVEIMKLGVTNFISRKN